MNPTLPGAWRIYGRAVAFVLAILFGVGAAGHLIPATLPLMLFLTPGFGLVTGALVAAPAVVIGKGRFLMWMAGTYVFTFWAEAAGVATGQIFGEYTYGPTLGWAWRGVPLLIAFNWVLVVHGAFCLSGRAVPSSLGIWRKPGIVLATGVVAVIFDFLMEPVAIRLDYWRWAGDAVPLQNYVAWFAIAVLSAIFHPQVACNSREMCSAGRLAGVYVVLQMVYFLTLRGMWHFQGA